MLLFVLSPLKRVQNNKRNLPVCVSVHAHASCPWHTKVSTVKRMYAIYHLSKQLTEVDALSYATERKIAPDMLS